MDYGFGGFDGGIWGLYELLVEYREAIHYDLLSLGLSIRHVGTARFGWDDFAVWVKFMPASSQLFQAVYGPQWSPELHRLTDVLDVLMAANWQRGGGHGARPKPVPRPGGKKKFGTATDLDVVRDRLTFLNGRSPGR